MASDSTPVEQLQAEQDRQAITQSGTDPFAAAREHLGAAPVTPMAEGKGQILGAIKQAGQGPQTQQTLTLGTPGAPSGTPAPSGPPPPPAPPVDAMLYGLRAGAQGLAGGAASVLEGLNALVDTVDPVRSQVRGAALILNGVIGMGLSPLAVPAGVIGQELANMAPELAAHTILSGPAAAAVKGLLNPLGAIASATDIGSGTPEAAARLSAAANALTEPITFRQALETGVQVATMIAASSVGKGAKAEPPVKPATPISGGKEAPIAAPPTPGITNALPPGPGQSAAEMGLPTLTDAQVSAFIEKATAEPGAPVPPEGTTGPRVFGVNWKRLGQEQDVNRVILQINKDLAAQGKMPAVEGANLPTNFADIAARARELGVTLDDVLNLPELPRRVTNLEQLDAFGAGVRAVRDVIVHRLVAESKMGAAGDAGARSDVAVLWAMAQKAAQGDKLTGENLAQALGGRRAASDATLAEAAPQAVLDLMERMQNLDGSESLPEMVTAAAKSGRGTLARFMDHVGDILVTGKDVLWEVWINDILGPVSAGAKALGDIIMLAKEPPQRMLARWNQKVFPMLFKGKPLELIAPHEGWVFARAAAEAIPNAVMQAFRGVKAGEIDIMAAVGGDRPYPNKFSAAKLPIPQSSGWKDFSPEVLPAKLINLMGMAIRVSGTTLGVITTVAKAANDAGARQAVATREAIFKGFTGEAAKTYITDAVQNATKNSAMALEAQQTREGNTFTGELGPFGQALTDAMNVAHLRSQTPFLRVPINLEKTATQLMPPFNLPSLLLKQGELNQALRTGGVERARAMATIESGALLAATVAYLTSQGIVRGPGPSDPRMREQAAAAGTPYSSITIGGTPYDLNRIKPIGGAILMTAAATEAFAQLPHTDNWLEWMGQLAYIHALAWGSVIKDASYFKGMKDTIEAINADDKTVAKAANQLVRGLASSAVPNTWVKTPNRLYFDGMIRDAGNATAAALKFVPGYSQMVAPHVDMLHGDPMMYPPSLGPGLVSPITMYENNPDPVAKVLVDNGIVIKALPWKVYPGKDNPTVPLKDVPEAIQGIELDRYGQQRYQWSQFMLKDTIGGKTMYEAIADRVHTAAFANASPGQGGGRDALVQEIVHAYQKMGHDKLLIENDQLRENVAARERARVIQKWTGGQTAPMPSLGR